MSESDLKSYVNDFFQDLVLYDDYHNNHNYKGLLKAGIDVFLDNETTYNAYEIYQTFFMIYQITSENKSDGANITQSSVVSEPNTLLDLVEILLQQVLIYLLGRPGTWFPGKEKVNRAP